MDVIEQGIQFVEAVDNAHRFTLHLERRRVMDILVDLSVEVAVPEGVTITPGFTLHPIRIAQVDAPAETSQATKGLAAATYELEGLAMGFVQRVQLSSVGSYVSPRLAHLVARLFVPPAA